MLKNIPSGTSRGTPEHTRAASAVRVLEWRELRRNTLLGFATVEFPSGLIIADVCVLSSERGPWASPPSKPMIDKDGTVLRDQSGKIRYAPIVEFRDRQARNRWSQAVIEAMRAAHPEVMP